MDGQEEVSKIIARYSAVERLFITGRPLEKDLDFEQSMIAVYVVILTVQATTAYYFGRKSLPRMIANATVSNDWTGMLKRLQNADQNCRAFITVKSTQIL